MIQLSAYQDLIQRLPVLEHGVISYREHWRETEDQFPELREINTRIFKNEDRVFINRSDILFDEHHSWKEFILKVVYWTFPTGMPGLRFQQLIFTWDKLAEELQNCPQQFLKDRLSQFEYMKRSGNTMISNFLYFLQAKIDGTGDALILNDEIIKLLQHGVFHEFETVKVDEESFDYKEVYINYLKVTNGLAHQWGVRPDQVEFFLQTFGGKLKPLEDRGAGSHFSISMAS